MTGRNTPSPDSVLHLLQEAGVDEDPALLEVVKDIAELAERPAPEPSAELAQLMADGGRTNGARRVKGRITFIGGALAVSMGVGMSGVAAGPADRQDEPDRSVDSVARFWALDHVDKVTPGPGPGPVAGPDVVSPPPSSDAVHPDSPDEVAPVARGAGGGVPSDGVLAGGFQLGAGLPSGLPAAQPGAAPSSITGVTMPSPPRQSVPGSASVPRSLSTSTSGPSTSAAQTYDPPASDPHASDPHTIVAQGGAGTSTGSMGESGDTPARGTAEAHEPAGHASRYVEEPVGYATLRRTDGGPDESTPDAAPAPVRLHAPAAAPDNVVFLAAPMSDDGQRLALFVPQVTELTWDPVTGEYVPWEPVSSEDAPGDAIPSPNSAPEAPVEVAGTLVPGVQPSPEALDGESDAVGPDPVEPVPAEPLPTPDAPVPAGEPSEAIPAPGPADGAPDEPSGSFPAAPVDGPATGR